MGAQESTVIDTNSISNIADVLHNLRELDDKLVLLHLSQFKLFNKAYWIVTNLIRQGIADNNFENPRFIDKFIVNFAMYYFDAVNDTFKADAKLSEPWAKLNEYATNKTAPVFISLMMGANAHINNDLPQVLVTMMKHEKPEELLGDILKIDKILMKSGKQIIPAFEEKNKFLNFLKNNLQITYYMPAMYTILYWRIRAWRNYEKLKNDDATIAHISKNSTKIAKRLIYIAKILG